MPRRESRKMAKQNGTNGRADRGRWSTKRKTEVVLRLLRGEDVDSVSRELGVTASTLSRWRDEFISGGQSAMKSRGGREPAEVKELQAKLGELMMENELLWKRAEAAESDRPFPWRKSRR